MKSTIKIDYTRSSVPTPCIKIVIPKEIENGKDSASFDENQDEDVRDKLIRDFLHTPLMENRNGFFELENYFDIPNHSVATISPIANEKLFMRFRYGILYKLLDDKDIQECRDFEGRNGSNLGDKLPCPQKWSIYKEVNDFFDKLDGSKAEPGMPW